MDWKKTLATVAPTLATAFGGPLAGMAVNIAAQALGVEQSEDAVSGAVLAGSPDTFLKLKQAEANLKVELKRLDIKVEELHGADRKSARELAKSNMLPQILLSTIYTAGYCAVLWQFVTGDVVIASQSEVTFNVILGVLTAAQTQVMNFWFGSSSGSKQKTTAMTDG